MNRNTITRLQARNERRTSIRDKMHVYTIRDWKEYLGESLLIVFSVLLALILTEYFNNLHEKEKTKEILKSIVAELRHNKQSINELTQYNRLVLQNIESALINKKMQQDLVAQDAFHLKVIAPQGVLYRYLNNEAWTVAQSNDVLTKIPLSDVIMLSKIYKDQFKIMKVEEEVAKVILDRSSTDIKQIHRTLTLIRDDYHAWAVDRSDGLIQQIDIAVKKLQVPF